MSTRFAWLLGAVTLVAIGVLVACGTTYNASSDGLVLVGSQGSAAIQTFSFNLGSGHVSAIDNPTSTTISSTCLLPGIPSSIVLDPAGAFAYAIVTANPACSGSATGILAFKVNSGGTLAVIGSPVPLTAEKQACVGGTLVTADPAIPAVPVALAMDSTGKFLFVADGLTTDTAVPPNQVPGAISVFSIGGGGTLTEVTDPATNAPFTVPSGCLAPSNPVAVGVTPTVFPSLGINGQQNAVCSSATPPTNEYLYMVDKSNSNGVWEFSVNTSTGVLGPNTTAIGFVTAGSVPSGITVDPCDRFVYVSNNQSNTINAWKICSAVSAQEGCPSADGSLVPIAGSPFSLSGGGANEPGPLTVDPFGTALYVVGTGSSTVSVFRIATVSGSLTPGSPATVATGLKPTSIAIRSDDSWLFVTNHDAGTMSQYSITPATGSLSPQPAVTTDNYPWGVAVK